MISIITAIIVGGIVGWLAGRIMKLRTSTIGYVALGIGGGLIGRGIAELLGIHAYTLLGSAALSLVGALVLILLLRRLRWVS